MEEEQREKPGRKPGPPSTRATFWIEMHLWQRLQQMRWGEKSHLINDLLKKHFDEKGARNKEV